MSTLYGNQDTEKKEKKVVDINAMPEESNENTTTDTNTMSEENKKKKIVDINELSEESDENTNINDISPEVVDNYFKQTGRYQKEKTSERTDEEEKVFKNINDIAPEKIENAYKNSLSALEKAYYDLQKEKKLTSNSSDALNAYFALKEEEDKAKLQKNTNVTQNKSTDEIKEKDKAKLQENTNVTQNKSKKEIEEEALSLAKEYVWIRDSIEILQKEYKDYPTYTKRVNDHKAQEKEIGILKNDLSNRCQMFKAGIESIKNDIRELMNSNTKKDSSAYIALQLALEPLLEMDPMPSKKQMSVYYNAVSKPIKDYLDHVQTKSSRLMLWGMTGRRRLNRVNHLNNLLRDGVPFLEESEKIQNRVDAYDYDKEEKELTGLKKKYEDIDEIRQKLVVRKGKIKKEVEKFGKTASKDVQSKLNKMTRLETKNNGKTLG